MTKLFLDDYRSPKDCASYMYRRIGARNNLYLDQAWVVVRNYPEFVDYISKSGLPDIISFDHDLADGHYHVNMQQGIINYEAESFKLNDFNKTGYHCAQWLIEYCEKHNQILPTFFVHSMNPVGWEAIESLLTNYKKHGTSKETNNKESN